MGQCRELHSCTQQFRISQHHVAQIGGSIFRNHAHKVFGCHIANVDALRGKLKSQRFADQLSIANRGDRCHFSPIAVPCLIQYCWIQLDGYFNKGLTKGRKTCREDREQQPYQRQKGHNNGDQTISAKARLLRVACSGTLVGRKQRMRPARRLG